MSSKRSTSGGPLIWRAGDVRVPRVTVTKGAQEPPTRGENRTPKWGWVWRARDLNGRPGKGGSRTVVPDNRDCRWPGLAPRGTKTMWVCARCVSSYLDGALPAWFATRKNVNYTEVPEGQVFFAASEEAVTAHAVESHLPAAGDRPPIRVVDPYGTAWACLHLGCDECLPILARGEEPTDWTKPPDEDEA